jgi:uncharacterized protein
LSSDQAPQRFGGGGATSTTGPPSDAGAVTLVTQARVGQEHAAGFERWQRQSGEAVAAFPGYIDGEFIAPSPPVQVDWVIVHRFVSLHAARAWLESDQRRTLLADLQPLLVGPIDVHLFTGDDRRVAPVSVIIATRVKPGRQAAFLAWQRRVAAVQAKFDGFHGYKLEPPIPGVQDEWVIVLRFDSDEHLDAWLKSPERLRLLAEAAVFDAETRIRKVRSGFEFWFAPQDVGAQHPPPTWKQNLLVLLVLYPVVFLFGKWVQTPLLVDQGVPFWLALFVGNAISVGLLGWLLVPYANRFFSWWLNPTGGNAIRLSWAGTALIVALYGVALVAFWRLG